MSRSDPPGGPADPGGGPGAPAGHVSPETLALLALGEDAATLADLAHLRACPSCRAELDQQAAVVHAGRTATAQDVPQHPSEQVWTRVLAQLRRGADRTAGSRRRVAAVAVAAAVAGALLGTVGTSLVARPEPQARPSITSTSSPSSTPPAGVVARGALHPKAMKRASGRAVVSRTGPASGPGSGPGSGRWSGRTVSVQVHGMPARAPGGGFYEVWLLDRAGDRLVSLGTLGPGERGRYAVPDTVDLARYPVLDVSVEPADGNPRHSGVSAVRGILHR